MKREYYYHLIRPDFRDAARRFYSHHYMNRTSNTYYEFPLITKQGKERWLGQNVRLKFEGDRFIGFEVVARDITDRKKAEDDLKSYKGTLEEIVEERTRELKDAQKELVNKAMEANGGTLAVTSPGKGMGAKVVIRLPSVGADTRDGGEI